MGATSFANVTSVSRSAAAAFVRRQRDQSGRR